MANGLYRVVHRGRYDLSVGRARSKVLHPSREIAEHWARLAIEQGDTAHVEEAKINAALTEQAAKLAKD